MTSPEQAVVDADLIWLDSSDQELVRTVQCPTAANDEDEIACDADATEKGVPGALLEADLPSIKLKRIPGVVVPTVPAAANALTAAAARIVSVEPSGGVGSGGADLSGSVGGHGRCGRADSGSTGSRRSRRRRLAALAAFREPDVMEEARAQRLRRKFHEKLGQKADSKYELVAGFHLDDGIILSYRAYRTRIHFELTERRRKILCRYYRSGEQEVLLYVDRSEFEYYSPVPCYRPPAQPPTMPPPTPRRQKSAQPQTPALSGVHNNGLGVSAVLDDAFDA
uniref:Uncharacterized protein n=1 Tax=Macrostomum lignano TaxID=282301 RepID=A0A1I8JKF7_9PLAT